MAYATLADLATYVGAESVEPGDERLLQRASDLIDAALSSSYYVVDVNGVATDTVVQSALMQATCAQVEWWKATGDSIGGIGHWQTQKVSPAALRQIMGSGMTATSRLAPRTVEVLTVKGIWRHKALAW